MKTNNLFIGYIGYVKYQNIFNKDFECDGFAITFQDDYSTYKYIDIYTKKEYKDFSSIYCSDGDSTIVKPRDITTFLQKFVTDYPLLEEFLNKKKLKNKDLKNLLNILNSVIYPIEKELGKKQNKEKYNNNNDIEPSSSSDKTDNSPQFDYNDDTQNKITSLSDYTNILTDKNFKLEPAIGRNNEIDDIIIKLAKNKGNPILVGPSGTGKTTIVDELAYKIQKNEVPDFLKNRQILEIDLASILSDTKYVGVLESKVTKLIDYAVKNNAILFIDEIHTIYGAGSHSKSDYDIAAMLKSAIDRQGLQVIGTTTTEEYNKYFSSNALKRRFIKILVDEPTNEILYQIINKIFNDYSKIYNIQLFDNTNAIINVLMELTKEKHRVWDDKEYNPSLAANIIDDIFAHARVRNQKKLTIDNIIYGINSCNRIYNSIKTDVINTLDIEKEEPPKTKILQFKK